MDGIGNPPFLCKPSRTGRTRSSTRPTWSRGRSGSAPLRLKPAAAAQRADLLHRCLQRPDRPAGPGAHPAWPDGAPRLVPDADEAGPARHVRPLPRQGLARARPGPPRRRDELARITRGYSPAMIEQVCSMALTIAHYDGRERFGYQHCRGDDEHRGRHRPQHRIRRAESRAVAIHEAGHAIAPRVHERIRVDAPLDPQARRGPSGTARRGRRRSGSVSWRNEEMADLVWGLGAMAAEHVFYSENSSGVGGDVHGPTARRRDGRRPRDGAGEGRPRHHIRRRE